jgi:hypothetical protein
LQHSVNLAYGELLEGKVCSPELWGERGYG